MPVLPVLGSLAAANGGYVVFKTSSLSLKDTLGLGMDQGYSKLVVSTDRDLINVTGLSCSFWLQSRPSLLMIY